MTMEIRGTLWRKYGHDRTYLTDEPAPRLGWIDNKTGTLTVDVEEHRDLLQAWVAANVLATVATRCAAVLVKPPTTARPHGNPEPGELAGAQLASPPLRWSWTGLT